MKQILLGAQIRHDIFRPPFAAWGKKDFGHCKRMTRESIARATSRVRSQPAKPARLAGRNPLLDGHSPGGVTATAVKLDWRGCV